LETRKKDLDEVERKLVKERDRRAVKRGKAFI